MIFLGCDQGGYELKEEIRRHFARNRIEYLDCGIESIESVDYPVYVKIVCNAVLNSTNEDDAVFFRNGNWYIRRGEHG